jgi:hypothetical protein
VGQLRGGTEAAIVLDIVAVLRYSLPRQRKKQRRIRSTSTQNRVCHAIEEVARPARFRARPRAGIVHLSGTQRAHDSVADRVTKASPA